jgi:replicative DNA helicase
MEDKEGSMIRLRHRLSPTTTASDEAEVYARKVENMKTRLLTINEKIIQHELRSIKEQHKVGCDGLGKGRKIETEKQIKKTLKMMQEIGNKKLVVLNTKISHNRELRRKIDEMRQERCRLDVIYTKLERDVQCQTEQMYMVLEEGKNAIKARDNAIGELEALNKQFEEGRRLGCGFYSCDLTTRALTST